MSKYKALRDEVITVLQGIQISGSSPFAEIAKVPKTQFDGYPSAVVLPNPTTSEHKTVRSNDRRYGLRIGIVQKLPEGEIPDSAVDTMLDIADLTMDALDATVDLNGKCISLSAAPFEWELVEGGDGLWLMGRYDLTALVSAVYR